MKQSKLKTNVSSFSFVLVFWWYNAAIANTMPSAAQGAVVIKQTLEIY